MQFTKGEQVVINEEVMELYKIEKRKNTPKKIIRQLNENQVTAQMSDGSNVVIGLKNYRLATPREIQIAKIKKIFIGD